MNPAPAILGFARIAALSLVLSGTALSAQTIVDDNFTTLGEDVALNGRTPSTTTTGVNNWIATAGFAGSASGTIDTFGSGGTATIELPALTSGNIYQLSADILVNNATSTQWLGIGFLNVSPTSSSTTVVNASSTRGAIFIRGNGQAQVYSSANSLLAATDTEAFTPGTPHNLRLIFDTTINNAWTLAAYVDGTLIDLNPGNPESVTHTYVSNPTLTRIGFSASSSIPVGSLVDNVSLTIIPEPAAAGFIALAPLALAFFRRRRNTD